MGLFDFSKNKKKQQKPNPSLLKQSEKETVPADNRPLAIKAAARATSEKVTIDSSASKKIQPDLAPGSQVVASPLPREASPSRPQELPDNYGDNDVYLLGCDPYRTYAYWGIREDHQKRQLNKLGGSWDSVVSVLRVYDITDKKDKKPPTDIVLQDSVRCWYVPTQPNHDYYAEIGLLHKDGRFRGLVRSNYVKTPRAAMSEIVDDQWMSVDFEKMYALSGGFEVGKSSEELTRLMEERFKNAITSGSGAGAVSSLSSPVKNQKREFRFWLECELIIYGGTEPDAQVTMQGRPVPLRPDGTFSFRYALPDGKFTYDCQAESSDGIEKRVIVPVVGRSTERPAPVLKALAKNTSESLAPVS